MSATNLPVDYFNYVVYGLGTGGSSGSGSSGDQIMNILQNMAIGLGDAVSASQIRIYAEKDFPEISFSNIAVLLELHPGSVKSVPILSSTTTAVIVLEVAARVTLRVAQTAKTEVVMAAITKAVKYLTGNTFGAKCVGNKTKVEKVTTTVLQPGVYQILISGTTSAIV